MNMKRSSKSISWAPGVKLCQVKLFSSLDCPVEVGMNYQDRLQAKTSSMLHSNSLESNYPPGFEVGITKTSSMLHSNSLKSNGHPHGFEVGISGSQSKLQLPRIQWRCPPKIIMGDDWRVAAGEESEEVEAQKQREMRVLEAVYPRFSAIPPSPSVSFEVECDHRLTPCVPINPIEEESQEDQVDFVPVNTSVSSQPPAFKQGLLPSGTLNASRSNPPGFESNPPGFESNPPGFEQPNVQGNVHYQSANFASVALAAIGKGTEKGSLIDMDLLIKILNDPKMIQKLTNVHEPQANSAIASTNTLAPSSKTVTPYVPSSLPNSEMQRITDGTFHIPGTVSTMNTIPQPETVRLSGLKRPSPSLALPPVPSIAPLSSFPAKETGTVKDMNYYKNLIRAHGTENNEMQDFELCDNGNNHIHLMNRNQNPAEQKVRVSKPCMFFKSPKGCRKGVHCEYAHDMSTHWRTGNVLKAHSAKRMKMSGLKTGRTMF